MNLFKASIFALGFILSTNAFAATGTGHAQAELTQPLSITNTQDIDFGVIAIDPAAGPQTVELAYVGGLTCPAAYTCTGVYRQGILRTAGAPNTTIYLSLEGSTAILSDGQGNQLIFDPRFANKKETYTHNPGENGIHDWGIFGTIQFTGNEPAGTYNTTNAGGSGYTVTVNY